MTNFDARWAQREADEQRRREETAARTPEERLAALKASGTFIAEDGHPGVCVPSSADVAWAVAEVERLRSYEPCEPCKDENHDHCTGDCPSMCCALAASEVEVERLRKVETAAGAVCDEWYYGGEDPSDLVARRLCDPLDALQATDGVIEDLAATLKPAELT